MKELLPLEERVRKLEEEVEQLKRIVESLLREPKLPDPMSPERTVDPSGNLISAF